MAVKYFLDLQNDGSFEFCTIEERDVLYRGHMEDAGITEDDDPMWQDKLDDFFEQTLGIKYNEWVIG